MTGILSHGYCIYQDAAGAGTIWPRPRQFEDWNKAWRLAAERRLAGNACSSSSPAKRARPRRPSSRNWPRRLGWPFIELAKTEVSPGGPQENLHQGRLPILRPAHQVRRTATCRSPSAIPSTPPCSAPCSSTPACRCNFALTTTDGDREVAQEVLRGRRRNAGRNRQGRRAAGVAGGGQGNHRGRPGGQRHQICQPDHLGGLQGPGHGHPFRAGGGRVAHPLPH